MVIGEGALPDDLDAAGAQRPEKPAGIADPGKGQHALAAQRRHRASSGFRCADSTGLPCAAMAAATASAAVPSPTTISASVRASCGGSGARSGPGGKHPGHCRGRGRRRSRSARHPWQSPGSENRRPSGSRWRPASAPARRRRCGRAQPTTGTVRASISGSSPTSAAACRCRIDHDRTAQSSAIAAAEHDRRLAEIAQQPGQRQHRRGLAGAADMIIADAEHGNAGIKPLALHPLGRDQRHRARRAASAIRDVHDDGRCQKAGSRIGRSHLEPQLQQIGLERGQRALERAAELFDHALGGRNRRRRARAGSASNWPSCFTSASGVSARLAPPAPSSAS